ncbi:hypothetical protein GWK47_045136 [Chionoecetes opilio]|uniref:Uncharacterized protein n=1 Tax=Chionoecetes opilio TaxID=41210 RepID=A0A8J5CXA6_CHIOP|nr:hypothetical protein GWK47_045136 [Chionoecetes opilio]
MAALVRPHPHSNFPYLRWQCSLRSGDGASLPVGDQAAHSPQRHRVPTQQWRTLGRKFCAGRLLLGDLAYPNVQLPATPTTVTNFAGGSMRLPGNHHCQVSWGLASTQSASTYPKACSTLLSAQGMQGPFAWSITPSRAPSPTSVCSVEPPDTQRPTSPGMPPSRTLYRENVDLRLEKWFFGALRAHWRFAMDARRYQR